MKNVEYPPMTGSWRFEYLRINFIGSDIEYRNPHIEINGIPLNREDTANLLSILRKTDLDKYFETRD